MSALLEDKSDSKYKDLFSKAVEGIKQLLANDKFKAIHGEVRKIVSRLTGETLPEPKKPEATVSFPGTEIAQLIDLPVGPEPGNASATIPALEGLSLGTVADEKTIPEPAAPPLQRWEEQKKKSKPEPGLLLDLPIDQPRAATATVPLDLTVTIQGPPETKSESIFGNVGTTTGKMVPETVKPLIPPNEVKKMMIKFDPLLAEGKQKAKLSGNDDKFFDFVDDVLK